MLLEFGLKNYFSFKEGISISFRLDSNCPKNISQGLNFTTVLGIKGANGSGKTHTLKGLGFLRYFCTNSFNLKPEEHIAVDSFYDSKEPIEIYAEFMVNENTYLYELSLTDTEVKEEVIYRKKGTNGKKTKIIERIGNELLPPTKEFSQLKSIKLRKNASIISTSHQYDFDDLEEIYNFFDLFISNVTYSGLKEIPNEIGTISQILKENQPILDFTKKFISECDTGISDIEIIESENETGGKKFIPFFIHKVADKDEFITNYTESSGTKALFRNLLSYYFALEKGGLLILDEFDTHLHPHILPKLLQLFINPESNKKNAQLIFSTHDSEIINLLGRYRTYLINKENNESFAFRLDEIPGDILRNDRPILPTYNDGKIGGVPRL